MNVRKRMLLVSIILFALCYSSQGKTPSAVLVLYDEGKDPRLPALTEARYLENLLGHFNAKVDLKPVLKYRAGLMSTYDTIFYINYEKKFQLPEEFKFDFYKNRKTFCWMNNQLGLLDQSFLKNTYGFHFREFSENQEFNRIDYKGRSFPKGDDNVNIAAIDDPKTAGVISYAYNDRGLKVPYITRSKNLWFIADSPFSYFTEADRYIAFADALHDIVGEDHPEKHTALVRIEDVNSNTDPRSLMKIMSYLNSRHIPFAVSLVPLYIDLNNKLEYHLEDRPALLSALKKIPSLGGTIVMHGYTHQYRGVSTDDYEFWDEIQDKPVRGDSIENSSIRIEKGLKELFNNDLYPFFWETPHYFASRNTHLAVKKFFTHVYDRRNVMEYLGSDQFLPFMIKDMYGQTVVPENLGYIHADDPKPKELINEAELNLAVRDGFASFFFHPFVDISNLQQLVTGIEKLGYTFTDIKSYLPGVTAHDKAILTRDSRVEITSQDKFISLAAFDYLGRRKSLKFFPNTAGKFSSEIKCQQKQYVVVKTQEEAEPGIITKIWRYAKTDLNYISRKKAKKETGKIFDVMSIAFINPARTMEPGRESNDLKSLKFSLNAAGAKFTEINSNDIPSLDLRDYDIIMIPYAAAKYLDETRLKRIKDAVSSGSHIFFDGITALPETFGIDLQENRFTVQKVRDFEFPDTLLYWEKASLERPVSKYLDRDYRILCVEEESNLPLAISGQYGKGSFIFLSPLFDPDTDRGYSRFPFLTEMLGACFNYVPLAERKTMEMYFDPGMRQFISIEKLVKMWRRYGINRIYAGGWHFYDKYSYDYSRLIRVCHENGILVYCWLEPPMVNQKFWNKYPAWREKTALLKDANVSWRYLMNLADPKCREKAFSEIESLLMKYDWDGVNLAELYFESAAGPQRPENFTPMNDVVRKEFKERAGFDPIELFRNDSVHYWQKDALNLDKFYDYRRSLCNRLKYNFLEMLSRVRVKKADFEIMMTVLDTTMTPGLEDYLAEDTKAFLQMQRKYKLALQIEDPSMMWTGKPERYEAIGSYYRKLIGDRNSLVIDCNILENHKKGAGGLPAEKPTGEEIRQIVYNMDISKARTAFYSEDSILENDFKNISTALARETTIVPENEQQWKIVTPNMVTIRTGKKSLITRLDDELWFAGEGENVIVPAGEHVLKFETERKYFDMESLKARLSYISCDLKWALFFNNGIEFGYSTGGNVPCYAVINKRPKKIIINNKNVYCQVLQGENGFAVRLPSGENSARISVGGSFSNLVETSGVVLLSLIIVFGFVTSILFLGLFAAIQVKRRLKL